MASRERVGWLTCDEGQCIGIRLRAGSKCLAHTGEEGRTAALEETAQTGKIDARGVTITSTLLKEFLDSVPRNSDGREMPADVLFDRATFQGDADFNGTIFQGDAEFHGATFQGDAMFFGSTFYGRAQFQEATFQGDAQFDGSTFQDVAKFSQATFERVAVFDGAKFKGYAVFDRVVFQGRAVFDEAIFYNAQYREATFRRNAAFFRATFQGDVVFGRATFQDDAMFGGATFQGVAACRDATFHGNASFDGATFHSVAQFGGVTFQDGAGFRAATFSDAAFSGAIFERAQQFGPLLAYKGLNLDAVQFSQPALIEASAPRICCRKARFPNGVQFRFRWADIVLDDTDIPAPSLLTGIPRLGSEELASAEQQISRDWKQQRADHVPARPRLLSLQRANVSGLGLSNVDLAGCRFSGAHNLDKLRLEADVTVRPSPARVSWEQRQVIAEECTWRASQARPGRWASPAWPGDQTDPWWPNDLEKPIALGPGAIASLYRALRKSREDAKDEPGAADFYYGEMEMRRHAYRRADRENGGAGGRVDRGVLTAYWLVSGYGLRAWRALAWLTGITVLFALAFHLVGFTRPPEPASYWTSLLYAFRSTISLTDDQVTLTAWGQLLQALLRLTGPVLLGLALLALRGRVKR